MRVTARELATARGSRQTGDAVRKRLAGTARGGGAARHLRTRRERDVQAAILAYLKTVPGVVAWRQNVGGMTKGAHHIRFGVKGLPDICGWIRWPQVVTHPYNRSDLPYFYARTLMIECKAPGGKLSAHQQAFRQMAERDGVLYVMATSVDDVLEALK